MNNAAKTLGDLKTFFEQQRELFGEETIVETRDQTPLNSVHEPVTESVLSIKESETPYVVKQSLPTLEELSKTVSACVKCGLSKTRTQTVFGSGNPKAELMFIGEAPGADEDAQGLPFVGRAGQLLTKMIEEERSLGMPRSQVYIANILKCRPPENRKPNPGEIEQCEPYLIKQIELIKPKLICALGATAANTLLRNNLPMGAMRGNLYDYHGTPLLVTYHPAALLRNPNWKQPAWEDMLKLKELLEKFKQRT